MNLMLWGWFWTKKLIVSTETYLHITIFGLFIQYSFKNPNCCKVGQVTKKLRKKLYGWNEQQEGGQRLPNLLIANIFYAYNIMD
jgi:hypothetical protein